MSGLKTVRIYLNEGKGRFENYDKNTAALELAYTMEPVAGVNETLLGQTFTVFNVNPPADYQRRSVSVGDVIEIISEYGSLWFAVQQIGFKQLNKSQLVIVDEELSTLTKWESNMFKKDLKNLLEFTKDCSDNMHEPDNSGITADIKGFVLDNAGGDAELAVVLKNNDNVKLQLNLANLIALARWAQVPGGSD
jgi:uncharacterized protein YllA (UPF0747 family)